MRTFILIFIIIILAIGLTVFSQTAFKERKINKESIADLKTGIINLGEINEVKEGKSAPDFLLLDFENRPVRLSDFKDSPVIIIFWASWCSSCIDELSLLDAFSKEYQDKGLKILGIHRTDTEAGSRGSKLANEQLGVRYALLQDKSGDVYKIYSKNQSFMPLVYFINKNGIIKKRFFSPATSNQIRNSLELIVN